MSWSGGSLDTAVEDELACEAAAEGGDGPVKGNGGGWGNREKEREWGGERARSLSLLHPFLFPRLSPTLFCARYATQAKEEQTSEKSPLFNRVFLKQTRKVS